jgi:hypothetical protein
MSDIARPKPPGKELAHGGNTSPSQQPAGKELATNANASLATQANANLAY